MSIEENKEIIRRLVGAGNTDEDIDPDQLLDELFSPDFVDHSPDPGQGPGLEGLKQHFQHYSNAFPDAQFILKDMVAEGDKVTVRMVRTGTHKGEYIGIPPTGRKFSVDDLSIYRVVNGKIVEHWEVFDRYTMLVQLGVISET